LNYQEKITQIRRNKEIEKGKYFNLKKENIPIRAKKISQLEERKISN
jgi:hypothetical protein